MPKVVSAQELPGFLALTAISLQSFDNCRSALRALICKLRDAHLQATLVDEVLHQLHGAAV